MPLSLSELKDRAIRFAQEWQTAADERADAQAFWIDFFHVFDVKRRRVASFEVPIKKAGGRQGFINLLWKGTLLVEHKSQGRDLDRAGQQAPDYFPLPPAPSPKQVAAVEAAAAQVLAARAEFPTESLATLYDPLTMPPALVRAHATLDRAVDLCYRLAAFATEFSRLEFLFAAYRALQAPLLPPPTKARRKTKT